MRFQAPLLLLFAVSTTSSPVAKARTPSLVLEQRTPPPRQQDICDWSSKLSDRGDGHAEEMGEIWRKSGASNYLHKFFDENAAIGWTDKFFAQSIDNGKNDNGGIYNCINRVGGGGCDGPESTPCESYTPAAAFYIHQGISNLRATIEYVHEEIQENMIEALLVSIEEISELFGNPKPDNPNGFLIIFSGIFGLASTATGLYVTLYVTSTRGLRSGRDVISGSSRDNKRACYMESNKGSI